jgi:hypothetical protein
MGLGDGPRGFDDIEWFTLDDVDDTPMQPYVDSMLAWLSDHPLWLPDGRDRVLLVDLDNVRAEASKLYARLALTVALARQSNYAAFAGQEATVRRSKPLLAEFGEGALAVGRGADEADWALLDAADAAEGSELQFIVASNDGIFAQLASRGSLTVLSPDGSRLSERLRYAAERIVDLTELEEQALGEVPVSV